MTKFEAEKFNIRNEFEFWRVKMKALLVQQGLEDTLEAKPRTMTIEEEKKLKSLQNKANRAIVLCLGDKVLRKEGDRPQSLFSSPLLFLDVH